MSLKSRLTQGQTVAGAFLSLSSPDLVEMLGHAGFDYVVIDAEHGALGEAAILSMIVAAAASRISALVRVPANQPFLISRCLDWGAEGLVIPDVSSRQEAEEVVAAAYPPPEGKRGLAGSIRAARFASLPLSQYIAEARQKTLVIVQVESAESVQNLDEIAAVQGVDVCYIGPTDLSLSMGYAGRPPDSALVETMADAVKKIRNHGKLAGIAVGSAEDGVRWADRGVQLVAFNAVSIVSKALAAVSSGFARRG